MSSPGPNAALMRQQKTALRRAVREKLATLNDRVGCSHRLCAAIASCEEWKGAACVGMFASMSHEPDLELLWSAAAGKTLVFPAIRGDALVFIAAPNAASLVAGAKGIREPRGNAVPLEQIDLLLVPGAAFSPNGERLGRSGGFYDRLLAERGFRAFTIGVCFECQLVPNLPTELHDRMVAAIATESGIQRVR